MNYLKKALCRIAYILLFVTLIVFTTISLFVSILAWIFFNFDLIDKLLEITYNCSNWLSDHGKFDNVIFD